MLRAEQRQVFQETNVRLVELRHLEIDYYFTVNAAIGTQSVLIGGFAYGLFTKNTNNGTEYGRLSLAAFYVTSAITIFASIHVVVMSLLLQVFGPGLALHGPAGSMARAAEVMLDEQRQVMVGFITMMVFFALSTVMCFWTAMDFVSACICTGVFVVAVRQWLYYWRRVYFKLYWDKSRAKRMFEDVKAHSDEPLVRQAFSKYVKNTTSYEVCRMHVSTIPLTYHIVSYYGLFFLCMVVMFWLYLQIYRMELQKDARVLKMPFRVAKQALTWYPFAMALFWLPHAITAVSPSIKAVYPYFLILKVYHALAVSLLFFYQSVESRWLWYSTFVAPCLPGYVAFHLEWYICGFSANYRSHRALSYVGEHRQTEFSVSSPVAGGSTKPLATSPASGGG
eukprot:gene8756-11237_t